MTIVFRSLRLGAADQGIRASFFAWDLGSLSAPRGLFFIGLIFRSNFDSILAAMKHETSTSK